MRWVHNQKHNASPSYMHEMIFSFNEFYLWEGESFFQWFCQNKLNATQSQFIQIWQWKYSFLFQRNSQKIHSTTIQIKVFSLFFSFAFQIKTTLSNEMKEFWNGICKLFTFSFQWSKGNKKQKCIYLSLTWNTFCKNRKYLSFFKKMNDS
jgi:hypothetical protein